MEKLTQTSLDKVLRLHRLWLASKVSGERAVFVNKDISRLDMRYADLTGANFNSALCVRTNFMGTMLAGAKFNHARCNSADFSDADMSGAECLGIDMRECDLTNTKLQLTGFWNATGNGKEIRTVQTPQYCINYIGNCIQIGCKNYTADEWAAFSDDDIKMMDHGALAWWKENKEYVMNTYQFINK